MAYYNKDNLYYMGINIDKDIKDDIKDFYVSKIDLENIKIPLDLNEVIEEPFLESKKEKKGYIISWVIDILLIIIIVVPIVCIYNPNTVSRFDKLHSFCVGVHNFLEKDNLLGILGANESGETLKNSKSVVLIKAEDVKNPRSNIEELKLIHSLANTLVKAEYKWECAEVTPETIKKAILGLDYLRDEYQRIYFRSNLEMWQEGNFSNAVSVHNKVWGILDGNVGEAYDLDEESIVKIKNKYFK